MDLVLTNLFLNAGFSCMYNLNNNCKDTDQRHLFVG